MSDQDKKWVARASYGSDHIITAVHPDHKDVTIWNTESADHVLSLLNAEPKPELPAEVVELLEYLNNNLPNFRDQIQQMVEACAHLLPPKLKPCPFCGGAAEVYKPFETEYIRCADKGCFMTRHGVGRDIWQRRAGDAGVGHD